MVIEYKFEPPEKEKNERQEDVRTNLHLTRCCANCKYYLKKKGNASHTGYCKYPNPSQKNLKTRLGESIDYEEVKRTWVKAHDTLLCDLYQFRGRGLSINPIEKWIEKEILNDGTMKEE